MKVMFLVSVGIVCIAGLVALGCSASSQMQVVLPEYESQSLYSPTLLVMPLAQELHAKVGQNSTPSKYELSGQDRAFFYRYFGAVVADVTTARVSGIDPDFRPDSVQYGLKQLVFGKKGNLEMYVPVSGEIRHEDTSPQFVLFVDDLFFSLKYEESMGGVGSGSREKYTMAAGMKYALWDNRAKKVASYGRLNRSFNLIAIPTKDDYMNALETFARAIISKSPLVIKQAIF